MKLPNLFEREAELAVLDGAVGKLAQGGGGTIAIEGPPGIGKTALLERVCDVAGEDDITLLRARCGEFELDFPFGVARQLFERRLRESPPADRDALLQGAASHAALALGIEPDAEDAASAEAPMSNADLPFTVIHGLYWLLANLAERGPIVVAVDDVQWCDDASLRLLSYLVPRLGELSVLLVVASRPADPARAAVLGPVLGGADVTGIAPAPLAIGGAQALLARDLDADVDDVFAQASLDTSGGNPFLLSELASSLVADGVKPTAENAERVRQLVPAAVVHSVLMRLGRMPHPCRELSDAIAVLGAEVESREAAALADVDPQQIGAPLEALQRATILASDRPLRFAHPLLREAVLAEMTSARREQLHARAADLLREQGASAADVAHHLLEAPRAGSREAVATLREAARSAVGRGAPEAGVTYLLRALAEPPGADAQAAIRYELGVAGWLAGRDPAALIEDLRAGLNGAWSPSERATRAIALGRALASVGDVEGAFAVLEGQLEAAGKGAGEAAARLRAEHGAIGLLHPETRERAIARIEARERPTEGGIGELLELGVSATLRSLDGSAAEAAELAERALDGGRLLAAEGADSMSFYVALFVLMVSDRHEAATRHLDAATAQARRGGSVFAFGSVGAMGAVLAWRQGDLPNAEARARSALEPGLAPAFTYPLVFTCLALALTDRGALEEAEREVERTGAGPHLPELMQVNMAFFARGVLRFAQGRNEEALDDLRELDRRDRRLGILNPAVPWRPVAVQAALRLDDRETALALAADEMEFAERWGTRTAMGQALRARGLARGEAGLDDLREATAVLRESPARRELTLALLDLGAGMRRAGQRREARDHLREALDLAQQCGATRLGALAQEELQVAGAKPRRLQFSGAESLTAAERRVAEMAAEGLANREIAETLFLSRRTVENHLSRVYRKLDINSRGQLVSAL